MSTRTTKRAGEQDPLVQAIVQKLATKDHASRLQRATTLAANLFPSDFPIKAVEASGNASHGPGIQEDLGQDPGSKAVGVFGVFGNSLGDLSFFSYCTKYDGRWYYDKDGDVHTCFRQIPTTPSVAKWLEENEE